MFCGENSSKTKEKKRKKEHGNMCVPSSTCSWILLRTLFHWKIKCVKLEGKSVTMNSPRSHDKLNQYRMGWFMQKKKKKRKACQPWLYSENACLTVIFLWNFGNTITQHKKRDPALHFKQQTTEVHTVVFNHSKRNFQ